MEQKEADFELKNCKIFFLSNFPPRECGIATFTQDLVDSMNKKWNPKVKSRVIALNEEASLYNYDNRVVMQLSKDDIEDYINIAKRINKSKNIKLVCIQHEFGLFGGDYGNYLIPFLETIKKPVVVTFHSILPSPDELRKKVVRFIASKSSAIIVMAKTAIDILNKDYGINKNKIYVVPHGTPNAPLDSIHNFKKKLRLENKTVISTFGLLSRGKGVEYMIKSLPELVKKYPNLLYLIMGETHPVVRKQEGESYRNELIKLVEQLGLKNNVKFYNKYLTLNEIVEYLLASDIYVCTNLDENQIVSGTLAYALSCGKAIVSTPSVYAREILAKDKGILVKFKNPDSFSEAIDKILSDKDFKKNMEENAYLFSRSMIWPNVASQYLNIFNKVVKLREETTEKYPKIKLLHLKNLTDSLGILQFSNKSTPDKDSGYTTDDNTRALIVSVLHNHIFNSEETLHLSKTYLNFLETAQHESGWFRTYTGKEIRHFSEDSLGRAIWALGYIINKSNNQEIIEKSIRIFDKSYKRIKELKHLRAKAYSIFGLYYYYKKTKYLGLLATLKNLADGIAKEYEANSSQEWNWFEGNLTYSNSSLPESLFLAYELTKDKRYLNIATKSFNFLSNLTFINDILHPIGQNGWFNRGGERAFFDQQPIDAASTVRTCLTAYRITKDKKYYKNAVLAFNWFLGKNHLNQMMYDESTGGCFDGLSTSSVNLNQGAESTISYLMARLFLEEFKKERISD